MLIDSDWKLFSALIHSTSKSLFIQYNNFSSLSRSQNAETSTTRRDRSEKVSNLFLKYFSEGYAQAAEYDLIPLLFLAEAYGVSELTNTIVSYMKANLANRNFVATLSTGLEINNQQLIAACLSYAWHRVPLNILKEIQTQSPALTAQFLNAIELLRRAGIHLNIIRQGIPGAGDLEITGDFGQETLLLAVDILCKWAPIHLNLKQMRELNDAVLNHVLVNAPHLQHLEIQGGFISKVHASNLITLVVYDCFKIKSVNVPQAEVVNCYRCATLNSLVTPKVIDLTVEFCDKLAVIDAPLGQISLLL